MSAIDNILSQLETGQADPELASLYGNWASVRSRQLERYRELIREFRIQFPDRTEIDLFSSPGRTEVGGNHTDHNAGRVLAAAVDVDSLAVVAKNNSRLVRIHSSGYPPAIVNLDQLDPVVTEKYTSTALARGVCARYRELGYAIGGFDAVVTSSVLKGSGLSSSASYELLISVILNHFYNDERVDPVTNARVSQFLENVHFGKPCGLMDQTAIAVGGFCMIDFKDFSQPIVKKIPFDFGASGFSLVIVNTGGDHADLNDDYAAIEREMKSVAEALGGRVLRDFSKDRLLADLSVLRPKVGDRAILRALHFYDDDQRVVKMVSALEQNQFEGFLEVVIESGRSSWMLLQNCYQGGQARQQGIPLGLSVAENLLTGRGAWRVHGGGFAGTIQAFVPNTILEKFVDKMREVFGPAAAHVLSIRSRGAIWIPFE